jgi:hypothetical protein
MWYPVDLVIVVVSVFGISHKIYSRKGGGVPASRNLEVLVFWVPGSKTVV